jgi:putative flavoprotein involved in K+ transport
MALGPERLDLRREGIRTVLWATGFRRDYPWLRVPVLDAAGEIRHREGITPVPGLYVLGLNFLRRRTSSFLTGVGADAEEIAAHILRARSPARTRAIA